MKKLFSIDSKYLIMFEDDRQLFYVSTVWQKGGDTHFYLNRDGEKVSPSQKKRTLVSETKENDWDKIQDSTMYQFPNEEGSYIFTTHPYKWDPDGDLGQFGVKNYKGQVIIPEEYLTIEFSNFGTISVCSISEELWGLRDSEGKELLPCIYYDPLYFNKYGVGIGNGCLINQDGTEIPETENNYYERIDENQRYISFHLSTPEEEKYINDCGTVPNAKISIYDCKKRSVLAKDVPEKMFNFYGLECEPEVILAAFAMSEEYDEIRIESEGIIELKKGEVTDIYDYYLN